MELKKGRVVDGTEYRRTRQGVLRRHFFPAHPPQISPGLFAQLMVQSESVRSRSSATDVAQKHCRVPLREKGKSGVGGEAYE